ncbi:hypothetical protein BT93_H1273 [Corymbia citriodora subsp. variegata]|nr:hypothetical protein BT93_H1273 [Corymbia citriodora subsp. variegata]
MIWFFLRTRELLGCSRHVLVSCQKALLMQYKCSKKTGRKASLQQKWVQPPFPAAAELAQGHLPSGNGAPTGPCPVWAKFQPRVFLFSHGSSLCSIDAPFLSFLGFFFPTPIETQRPNT